MSQLHKKFSDEQVRVLFSQYGESLLTSQQVQDYLGIGKTHFFALLKRYRQDPQAFTLAYRRSTTRRLPAQAEDAIKEALLAEKAIVEDPDLPISSYNYSAMRDRLRDRGVEVSLPTIIKHAKQLGCHKPRRKRKAHDREVLTASIGALVQHDSSLHQWSPFAGEKWYLVTSIDDYSRKLLYADFVPAETSWAHIQAVQTLVERFGVPLRYYVDSLRVFRFVQGRDSVWRKHVLETDDTLTQWGQVMQRLGVEVIHALSPQAKGKVERPYRWLQDRIVRTCVYEKLSSLEEVRQALHAEMYRYNHRQVHATTGEVPAIRFQRAQKEGNSLFRKFTIPQPFNSPEDVFCLREKRRVNGYRRISLFRHEIEVPKVPLREEVDIHLVPLPGKDQIKLRIWWNGQNVHRLTLPLNAFRVHL
jgi:hypothetical protein